MHLTPSEASEHIKESMIEYLETACDDSLGLKPGASQARA
jgi:hypothetical protein